MTQNKKNFKKHSLVGSGARAVALAFAALPLFALNQDAAAQAPNAPYPAAANAQGPVAPAIQAPAPQVPATQAPAQYSPLAAAPQQGPYGPAANASARSNAEELPPCAKEPRRSKRSSNARRRLWQNSRNSRGTTRNS